MKVSRRVSKAARKAQLMAIVEFNEAQAREQAEQPQPFTETVSERDNVNNDAAQVVSL